MEYRIAKANRIAKQDRRRPMPVNGRSVFIIQATIAKKGREVK